MLDTFIIVLKNLLYVLPFGFTSLYHTDRAIASRLTQNFTLNSRNRAASVVGVLLVVRFEPVDGLLAVRDKEIVGFAEVTAAEKAAVGG